MAEPRGILVDAYSTGNYLPPAFDRPCVAKPLASASTDGVFICRNAADLRAAFPAILSTKDIFDGNNERVLVQSFLTGTEYIVDTVSVDGHAYVCGVWQYDKRLLANG